jgi:hypothetical protein
MQIRRAQSTSRVIVAAEVEGIDRAKSKTTPGRSSDFLCSHQRMSRPVQKAINMPAATGPKGFVKVQDAAADHSTGDGGVHPQITVSFSNPRHFA